MAKGGQVFIVEGPDCSGKSTLCENLHQAFGYPVYHLTYYKDQEKMREQFMYIKSKIDEGENIIVDRFILSNIIYGDVFHKGETVSNLDELMYYLGCDNSTLIIALPEDRDDWMNRFAKMCEEREEMYPDTEKMLQVYNLFKHYSMILSRGCYIPNLIMYDFTKNLKNNVHHTGR